LCCGRSPQLGAAAGEETPPLNSSLLSPPGHRDLLNTQPATPVLRERGKRHEPPTSPPHAARAAQGEVMPKEETPLVNAPPTLCQAQRHEPPPGTSTPATAHEAKLCVLKQTVKQVGYNVHLLYLRLCGIMITGRLS